MELKEDKMRLLLDMFGHESQTSIFTICEENNWNVENCIDILLKRNENNIQGSTSGKKNSENSGRGAVPKESRNLTANGNIVNYSFSPIERKIINEIQSGYRVMVILRGAPGSGKSWLARYLVENSVTNIQSQNVQDFIFSTDDYFINNRGVYEYKVENLSAAHDANHLRVEAKAAGGWSPIFIDNTNMQIWEMLPYVKIALKYGYIVELLEPKTPWKYSAGKLAMRNKHGVPRDKIQIILNRYEGTNAYELIKMFKNNYGGYDPQMRNYPPLNNVSPNPSTLDDKVKVSSDVQNKLDNLQFAPKGQRKNFSKKDTRTNSQPKANNNNNNNNLNNNNDNSKNENQAGFLSALKESLSTLPTNVDEIEDDTEKESVKPPLERHSVNCPNENETFALFRQIYIHRSVNGLWDLFMKCNGDIDWAVDILLKEEKLLPNGNSEAVAGEMENDFECNCANIDLNIPAKISAVEQNIISTETVNKPSSLTTHFRGPQKYRLQAEQRKVKSIVESAFVFRDEYYTNSMQRHLHHGNNNAQRITLASAPISTPVMTKLDASTQTDNFDEKTGYNSCSEDIVEMCLESKIFEQLSSIFQAETLDNGLQFNSKQDSLNIFLPRSLAKELYMLCMESVHNQLEEQRQQTLHEDENFAKLIQNLKYSDIKQAPENTQELLDYEMAWRLSSMELKNNQLNQLPPKPANLAMHLRLLKLADDFPETPPDVLLEVLQAHNNDYDETMQVLLNNTNSAKSSQQNQEKLQQSNEEKSKQNEVPESSVDDDVPNKSTLPLEESKRLALSKFEEARNLAVHHCQLKAECYQKAKEMIQRGNPAVAVYYSEIANMHKRKIDMYNECAANSIVEVHRYSKDNPDLLDLHYLHVAEAVGCLDLFLDRHISSLRNTTRTYKNVFIITGRGLHSTGGVSTIKKKVKNRLKDRNLKWNEVNPGLLRVKVFSASRFSK